MRESMLGPSTHGQLLTRHDFLPRWNGVILGVSFPFEKYKRIKSVRLLINDIEIIAFGYDDIQTPMTQHAFRVGEKVSIETDVAIRYLTLLIGVLEPNEYECYLEDYQNRLAGRHKFEVKS